MLVRNTWKWQYALMAVLLLLTMVMAGGCSGGSGRSGDQAGDSPIDTPTDPDDPGDGDSDFDYQYGDEIVIDVTFNGDNQFVFEYQPYEDETGEKLAIAAGFTLAANPGHFVFVRGYGFLVATTGITPSLVIVGDNVVFQASNADGSTRAVITIDIADRTYHTEFYENGVPKEDASFDGGGGFVRNDEPVELHNPDVDDGNGDGGNGDGDGDNVTSDPSNPDPDPDNPNPDNPNPDQPGGDDNGDGNGDGNGDNGGGSGGGDSGGGGSNPTPTTYTITVPTVTGGTVTASQTSATAGTKITVTVTPQAPTTDDLGYWMEILTVLDANKKPVVLTKVEGETYKYTFTMPAQAVTVVATFSPILSYRYYDDEQKEWHTDATCSSYRVLRDSSQPMTLGDAAREIWYVVRGSVQCDGVLTIDGSVHLILLDGARLTLGNGASLTDNGHLQIYSQSTDPDTMGKLAAVTDSDQGKLSVMGEAATNATDMQVDVVGPGSLTIHGGTINVAAGDTSSYGISVSNLAVYGGMITVAGGTDTTVRKRNAIFVNKLEVAGGVLGSSMDDTNIQVLAGGFTMSGGTVTASGGALESGTGLAGLQAAGNITISGGNLTVIGGNINSTTSGTGGSGMSVSGTLSISGASTQVTARGGEAANGGLGLFEIGTLTMSGGILTVFGGKGENSGGEGLYATNMAITGGTLTIKGGAGGNGHGIHIHSRFEQNGGILTVTGGAGSTIPGGSGLFAKTIVIEKQAELIATGGGSSQSGAGGNGIDCTDDNGSVSISDTANLTATGGDTYGNNLSHGIYCYSGNLTLASPNVRAGGGQALSNVGSGINSGHSTTCSITLATGLILYGSDTDSNYQNTDAGYRYDGAGSSISYLPKRYMWTEED